MQGRGIVVRGVETAPGALDEGAVRDWVGEGALARARRYVAERRVVFPRREGSALSASCRGSLPTPYEVDVQVAAGRIEAGFCTCPVGGDGRCKHVAAVLLWWLDDPTAFVAPQELARDLEQRPSSELATIILRMIRRYPDLRSLLDLPTGGSGRDEPPDPEILRRAVSEALVRGRYDAWRAGETIAVDLTDLLDLAASYRGHDDWRSAALVYEVICTGIMDRYMAVEDEGRHLASVLVASIGGLGDILASVADAPDRARFLTLLWQAYEWDLQEAGLGIDDQVRELLLAHASADERHLVSAWAWEAMPAGAAAPRLYVRRGLGRLLLDLEGETLSDPVYISICREAALWGELVAHLLDRGRLAEALQVTTEAEDDDLLPLVDLLCCAGHAAQARELVLDRIGASSDARWLVWLKEQARVAGDPAAAKALAEQLFWRQPSLERYAELRDLSQPLGHWDEEHDRIVARLLSEGRHEALMRIALSEGDLEGALGYADDSSLPSDPRGFGVYVATARATEAGRPRDAIRLYLAYVDALVRSRNRGGYGEAAAVLRRVRRLYRRLGEDVTWNTLMAQLRADHRRLRAFQDELTRAHIPPQPGDVWNANFYRIDRAEDGDEYSAWSPTYRRNYHTPERFGRLVFSAAEV